MSAASWSSTLMARWWAAVRWSPCNHAGRTSWSSPRHPRRSHPVGGGQPLERNRLEHGRHEGAALRGLDRQDRRRIVLVTETEHVLPEVTEAALGLPFECRDRPDLARRRERWMRPDDPVELRRLRV